MSRSFPFLPAGMALLMAVSACTEPPGSDAAGSDRSIPRSAPPGAPAGTCWDRHISPAVIETVTIQVQVEPELRDSSGQVVKPAVFRTDTRQDILRPRSESWLQITCPVDMTPDFIASLQRALAVRGYYDGAVNGNLDRPTRHAILRYQRQYQLESQLLSIESARRLGLISVVN